MQEKLQQLKKEALEALDKVKDKIRLEEWENKFLGRKSGELTNLMKGLKDLSDESKTVVGRVANEVKQSLEELAFTKRQDLATADFKNSVAKEKIDISEPSLIKSNLGSFHPNTIVQKKLEELFSSMGFMILDGPELESDYYNFEALNIPPTHPARDMQDTFYIKDHKNWVMRTHTSPVQVRALQKYGAPLRAVVPGRCFRNESTDAAHEHTFYQLEGLVVDKNISISHLIGVMKELLKGVLGREVEVRLRPGFFPFVEPGFELDMKCLVCGGVGCGACKHSGWIETLPCGLVHPRVLEYGDLNPKEWSGFAFGLGMTRLVMQNYGIEDIRHLQEGDLRFLKQF
ncbi:MAG TPA: phenylalanine--tRNA ligase subunit alpha [Candidatus Magasanikbacteria bacterium]|uniref:Phenylalanine--tRNA ligase alpha subunit n=1 Tax=Candidatus Magasanikbacteria bacterium GW2011_GWA2_42_32 TaxID=1619039 RepID=A0A0G1D3Y7_9BACT|nr:MAG: Phenylalanine-tRNA ligase alpha subunit [Candidatus Magasanikbacteria bacterium GW2011_GWC2_40_17]KKS56723.1 MAG: Phenylalanine-tRNA ligase alpha subunit [Candidatus Magasanikbacteria bacterium GW2011_GWA2_42_32]HBV58025.1 phenylalanine--tRNA ligase subunit alpha [Candidatus Magasanikbacteria bacterium]